MKWFSISETDTQHNREVGLLRTHGIIRLSEFKDIQITAATISRLVENGEVLRLSRGLYQLRDAPIEAHHSLAEAAKRVPKGVVCLTSALAYHELTDQLPRAVWMAIGTKDWAPKEDGLPIRIVRFTNALLPDDVITVYIENVPVKNLWSGQDHCGLFSTSLYGRPSGCTGSTAGGASAMKGQSR